VGDQILALLMRLRNRRGAIRRLGEVEDSLLNPQWMEILSPEDQAQRAHVWGNEKYDRLIMRQLQAKHQKVVDEIWRTMSTKVSLGVEKLLTDFSPDISIELMYPCDHFSKCYALNRFLVLLVKKYLDYAQKYPVTFTSGKYFKRAVPADGHGCGSSSKCHGKSHTVYLGKLGVWLRAR
jgi:hypothetical protein